MALTRGSKGAGGLSRVGCWGFLCQGQSSLAVLGVRAALVRQSSPRELIERGKDVRDVRDVRST